MYNDELFYNILKIILGVVGVIVAVIIFALIIIGIAKSIVENWKALLNFFLKVLIIMALIIICGTSGLFLFYVYYGLCKFSPDLSTTLTIISEIIIIIIMIIIKNIIDEIIFDNLPVHDSYFWCPTCSRDNIDKKEHRKYNYWICECRACGKKWCVRKGGGGNINHDDPSLPFYGE